MTVRPAVLALASVLLLVASRPAAAAWPHLPGVNVRLAEGPWGKWHAEVAADGAGGAYFAWHDFRSGSADVHYTRRLASGELPPFTPPDGSVCVAPGNQNSVVIAADGAGGAYLAWVDYRGGAFSDIYAHRILPSGELDSSWPANGLAVCTAPGNQSAPVLHCAESGAVLIAWTDQRGPHPDIYAQRVLFWGAVDSSWPVNGRALCTAAGAQTQPAIASDGDYGAIVAWADGRAGASDVYAQHVHTWGAVDPTWPVNGRALTVAAGDQSAPAIVADGSGGAIVAWRDARAGIGSEDVYAQRITASGAIATTWPADGLAVCAAPGPQWEPRLVTDGEGGALVAWSDERGAGADIYVHRLRPAGVDPAWPVNGLAVCAAAGDQFEPIPIPDGGGGAVVAWYDERSGSGFDVYAQHVLPGGALGWPSGGRAVSTAAGHQAPVRGASDGAGGAILAWLDSRAGTSNDLYAQRIERFGRLGNPEPLLQDVRDVGNDQGGRVLVTWSPSYLDAYPLLEVDSYSLWRRVPGALHLRAAALESAAEGRRRGTVMALPGAGGQTAYWEYLESLPARGLSGYSRVAETTSDSLPGSNPTTAFLVMAETAGGEFWASAADSGYSVDNLAPATPSLLAGSYQGKGTRVRWVPNGEADLSHYRVYRGSSPDFVPGPGNLVGSPPDTGFTDAGHGGFHYRVSAVDVHGNESGHALLAPQGTLGVGEGGARGVSLAPPSPNPARGGSLLRFSLEREARISLAVFDAAGRRVRSLIEGPRPAGAHAHRWDLADDRGVAVAGGLYFVRLDAGGRPAVRSLVVAP